MEKKSMPNSIVLSEALSIPEKINKFILNDNNNYQEVSKLISEKKCKDSSILVHKYSISEMVKNYDNLYEKIFYD